MLINWCEVPKIFGVFISGAKRWKIVNAYLCGNPENCLSPPSAALFQCPKYWEIVYTPFMGGRGLKRYSLVYIPYQKIQI
jgi:hypothetical protein